MDVEHLQPQRYEEFKHILQTDRMSHAYLFIGDFASLEMAFLLAKSRFCENKIAGIPCGNCRECKLIARGEFSDVKLVKPEGQMIKTDVIRELMRDFSRSGVEGKSQVFIIEDCDKMHVNAANSLLKFIEEPQSSSYMILLTSDENKVLPTIRSRTQIFRFPKNKQFLMDEALKAGILISQAEILVELAKNPSHLMELIAAKKNLTLIELCQHFVETLFRDKLQAYLETGLLVQAATDKTEQDLIFQLLSILLGKQLHHQLSLDYLEKVYQAQRMWRSNVSFQNAIEYMVIA